MLDNDQLFSVCAHAQEKIDYLLTENNLDDVETGWSMPLFPYNADISKNEYPVLAF